jgi:hypothetical protein
VRAGLDAFNARAKGSGGRVGRALVLAEAPDAGAGEITDKGYIAQASPAPGARTASRASSPTHPPQT